MSTTRDIRITARPQFMEEQSKPGESNFVWAYTIVIENKGNETVQLMTRMWHITDAKGGQQVVQGDGVVGRQPTLPPGATFEYTSSCPLHTPSGMMMGSYRMVTRAGDEFEAVIPAFSLDSPYDTRSLN